MCVMELLNELRALGVDVDDGVKRIMGNEKLYRKLLGSYVKMVESQSVDLEFDSSDCTAITERVHAIKGTAGNLSITPVYEGSTGGSLPPRPSVTSRRRPGQCCGRCSLCRRRSSPVLRTVCSRKRNADLYGRSCGVVGFSHGAVLVSGNLHRNLEDTC